MLFPDGTALDLDENSSIELQSPTLLRLVTGRPHPLTVAGAADPASAVTLSDRHAGRPRRPPTARRIPRSRCCDGRDGRRPNSRSCAAAAALTTERGSIAVRAGERSVASRRRAAVVSADVQFRALRRLRPLGRAAATRGAARPRRPRNICRRSADLRRHARSVRLVAVRRRHTATSGIRRSPRTGGPTTTATGRRSRPTAGPGSALDAWAGRRITTAAGVMPRSRWFWIPDRRWGPAWVSWAAAPGYVSWCPLGFDNRPVFALSIGVGNLVGRLGRCVPRRSFGSRDCYVNRYAVRRACCRARRRSSFNRVGAGRACRAVIGRRSRRRTASRRAGRRSSEPIAGIVEPLVGARRSSSGDMPRTGNPVDDRRLTAAANARRRRAATARPTTARLQTAAAATPGARPGGRSRDAAGGAADGRRRSRSAGPQPAEHRHATRAGPADRPAVVRLPPATRRRSTTPPRARRRARPRPVGRSRRCRAAIGRRRADRPRSPDAATPRYAPRRRRRRVQRQRRIAVSRGAIQRPRPVDRSTVASLPRRRTVPARSPRARRRGCTRVQARPERAAPAAAPSRVASAPSLDGRGIDPRRRQTPLGSDRGPLRHPLRPQRRHRRALRRRGDARHPERRAVRLRRRPAADLRARRLLAEHDHARLRRQRSGDRRVRDRSGGWSSATTTSTRCCARASSRPRTPSSTATSASTSGASRVRGRDRHRSSAGARRAPAR